jgi:hypothetical protein
VVGDDIYSSGECLSGVSEQLARSPSAGIAKTIKPPPRARRPYSQHQEAVARCDELAIIGLENDKLDTLYDLIEIAMHWGPK